jgi:hypothetical protein
LHASITLTTSASATPVEMLGDLSPRTARE